MIDKHYEKALGVSNKSFVNFVKLNSPDITDSNLKDIDYLAHRVAQNMFLYPGNIDTAKADYIDLIALLIRKGVIFEEYKDLKPDPDSY